MSQSVYGIDLAKHSFSIHGEVQQGKVLTHKTITRSKVLSTFANIPPAIIDMEARETSQRKTFGQTNEEKLHKIPL
ncbi:hypothetical protein Q4491_02400 [Photobacterium sp. 2_MG-2023]|uniref:hypothetical protein n=1 Tax=Photobacterium sp. 2_MG-2023 TaxID=3062663 RepID=UPI0026E19AF9|nr:hypothetical protein [Photobacterium sp. 2_MG-2023]MDO6580183.1 hypothetical protein [Photobacterium sp. 2_MG-2023]